MAQIEEKESKVNTNSPKNKKSVKKANTKPQEQVKEEYHTSKVGDNPHNLSVMYGTSIDEIKNLNPSINWLNMKEGTKVRVK